MISEVKVSLQKAEPVSMSKEGGSQRGRTVNEDCTKDSTKGDEVMTSGVKSRSRKRNLKSNQERLSAAMRKNRKRELHKVILLRELFF